MSDKSTWARNAVLDWLLGGSTPTRPTANYMSLHSADPGLTGTSELSGNGYARSEVTFGAASGGTCSNTDAPDFTASGGDFAEATYFGIWDASSGGNFLYGDELTTAKTIEDGETGTFAIGDIDATEA